jgi:Ca-activated chloride channel family protein
MSAHGSHEPTVRFRRERRYRPVEASRVHIVTTIQAPQIVDPGRGRPVWDVAFVLDRSGSMGGGAYDLARQGVEHALALLDSRDSVSVTVYDDQVDTVLTQRPLDHETRQKAIRRMRRVGPRGSTDLGGGWLTGCDQLTQIADSARAGKPLCRVLLLTDGLANVGITDADELALHARGLARRGISTSTLGVGAHYDEELLGAMADAGGGRYHSIASPADIPIVFQGELGEMLQTAMRDATLSVRLPAGWGVHLLNDLPLEAEHGWVRVPLGNLFSNDSRQLVWEIDLPPATEGHDDAVEARLTWSSPDGLHQFDVECRDVIGARSRPGDVDHEAGYAIATQIAARAKAQAVAMNRRGAVDEARQMLEAALQSIPAPAAAPDVVRDLERATADLSRRASAQVLKARHAEARYAARTQIDYTRRPDSPKQ